MAQLKTLQDAIDEVRRRIDEAAGGQWQDATLEAFINQACEDVARSSHCVRRKRIIGLVPGQQLYDLSNLEMLHLMNTAVWFSGAEHQIAGRFSTGDGLGYDLVIDDDKGLGFVADYPNDSCIVFSTIHNKISSSLAFTAADAPICVTFNPNTAMVYVGLQGAGEVHYFTSDEEPTTSTAVSDIGTLLAGTLALGCEKVQNIICAACFTLGGALAVKIDGPTQTVAGSAALTGMSLAVDVDHHEGKAYYPVFGADIVEVVGVTGWTVDASIAVGAGPIDIAVDSENSEAYVLNQTDNSVSVIDTTTDTVTATITSVADATPTGIAVDVARRLVYVAGYQQLTVIDAVTQEITETIMLDMNARCVAVEQASANVYGIGLVANVLILIGTVPSGRTKDLVCVPRVEMDRWWHQNRSLEGEPERVFVDESLENVETIGLWPVPSAAAFLEVTYAGLPKRMVVSTAKIDMPAHMREYAIRLATAKALSRKGMDVTADLLDLRTELEDIRLTNYQRSASVESMNDVDMTMGHV